MPLDVFSSSLKKLLARAERAVEFYYDLVEPVMRHPRHRETLCGCICDLDLCWSSAMMLEELSREIERRRVCVAGPLAFNLDLNHCDVIGAPEGGLLPLVEAGVRPLYVTGDLDLDSKLLSLLFEIPRVLLVHIHGDNFSKVLETVKKRSVSLSTKIVVTTQVRTCGCSMSLGGYTDGDRAVLLPVVLGAKEVVAYGYVFNKASFLHKASAVAIDYKNLKLSLASRLIKEISATYGYTLRETSDGTVVLMRTEI